MKQQDYYFNMGKINFTKEHQIELYNKATVALFNKKTFRGQANGVYTIFDLLHNLTINSLKSMLTVIKKKIDDAEADDEFTMTEAEQAKVTEMREEKALLTLIIGYKRWQEEVQENREKKLKLQEKLNKLKDSQKTPEDRIKELEAEIAGLDD